MKIIIKAVFALALMGVAAPSIARAEDAPPADGKKDSTKKKDDKKKDAKKDAKKEGGSW